MICHSRLRNIILSALRVNCRVGGGAKRQYPPFGMMGIAESILSPAEGLHPSYGGIAAQPTAEN